jgi:hypothetical protein
MQRYIFAIFFNWFGKFNIVMENVIYAPKIGGNRWKSPKIAENWRKLAKIAENLRKSPKITENRRK